MAEFWTERLAGATGLPATPGVARPSRFIDARPSSPSIPGDPRQFGVHTVNVQIQFDATGEFQEAMNRLLTIAENPALLAKLVQQAVGETIVRNVRERFIQNLPNALEMQSVPKSGRGSDLRRRARKTQMMERIQQIYDTISEYEAKGDTTAADKARDRLMELNRDWYEDLNTGPTGNKITPHKLSSGLFRAQAMRVLALLTDTGLMNTTVSGNGDVTVQVANRKSLNEIKTPSATEHVFKLHRTNSKYDTMWRHLEFGTGIYGKDPLAANRKASRYSARKSTALESAESAGMAAGDTSDAQGGMWWYAKQPPHGLLLKGSKGIHALRHASGQGYGEDIDALEARFGDLLRHALLGTKR